MNKKAPFTVTVLADPPFCLGEDLEVRISFDPAPNADWGECEELALLVVMDGGDEIEVRNYYQTVRLLKTKGAVCGNFLLTPLVVGKHKLRISVYLDRERTLLQRWSFDIEIVD